MQSNGSSWKKRLSAAAVQVGEDVDEETRIADLRAHVNMAFDLIDTNGDGVISVPELTFYDRRVGASRRRGSIFDEMVNFNRLDADGDGVITRGEFVQAVADCATDSRVIDMIDRVARGGKTWQQREDELALKKAAEQSEQELSHEDAEAPEAEAKTEAEVAPAPTEEASESEVPERLSVAEAQQAKAALKEGLEEETATDKVALGVFLKAVLKLRRPMRRRVSVEAMAASVLGMSDEIADLHEERQAVTKAADVAQDPHIQLEAASLALATDAVCSMFTHAIGTLGELSQDPGLESAEDLHTQQLEAVSFALVRAHARGSCV